MVFLVHAKYVILENIFLFVWGFFSRNFLMWKEDGEAVVVNLIK